MTAENVTIDPQESAVSEPAEASGPSTPPTHRISYPRFLWMVLARATDGGRAYYATMTVLTAIALVGLHAWATQVAEGMAVTGMSDHVSWGLYIANFTFGVGLAAGGVMMVVPAYLYDDEEMHRVVLFGEILAIGAIVVSLLFVVADLGRPDRFWHLLPGIGRFHWPVSMLTWDVVVLNGYLLLNLHVVGYLLYHRYLGVKPNPRWYLPFVLLSIAWAISIHTVTAFLYAGLGGRPFWNSALLAPRFLASAFVSGPALIVVMLRLVAGFSGFSVGVGPERTLLSILRITVLINLFMIASELFVAFYSGGHHAHAVTYLFFGVHGKTALVPWMWTAITCDLAAATLLFWPTNITSKRIVTACLLAIVGVWIEKGMCLIIPGFVPSTMGELVEYRPTSLEWQLTAGAWAFGTMIVLVGCKVAGEILSGGGSANTGSENTGSEAAW